ncbi:Uma2 family endonuclease [Thermomicrobium sp. 4228-Ro]|uniref:Uma2 family endonuclease n=1 Tax=Thermomicrobium sp. 4228-Ro TaxID=2993937 RepID=UPI0022494F0A|nr:Uma2 family endonuclease [Thermomicrobium sp. 4228-Ro]MCX2728290.1 Uma2 family endonuclease [Thermomicrobium sp. 4228-Ro]
MAQATGRLPTTHRFTVDDLERMVRAGILREDARVELIEGELYDMNPIGWAHQACVNRLTELFVRALHGRAIVQPQGPVRLSDRSLPQPDLALLRPRADFYARSGPGPADVLLLVEVSDTTLAYDRDIKVPLYARAGIPEVWLVDLAGEQVLAFRLPDAGGYRYSSVHRPGELVSPQAFPDMSLAVDDLVGA